MDTGESSLKKVFPATALTAVLGLDDFEFKGEFLAPEDRREIELPELSGEAKRGPSLIQIDDKLNP